MTTSLGNSQKNRGRPIRPQITRGTKSGEADRSRPCEARGISFRKSYAAFSPFLYECLYVCCCRTREPRARRRPVFRSPGSGAGCARRPMCMARRGSLVTSLSTPGLVVTARSPKRARGCSCGSGITPTGDPQNHFHDHKNGFPRHILTPYASIHRADHPPDEKERRKPPKDTEPLLTAVIHIRHKATNSPNMAIAARIWRI